MNALYEVCVDGYYHLEKTLCGNVSWLIETIVRMDNYVDHKVEVERDTYFVIFNSDVQTSLCNLETLLRWQSIRGEMRNQTKYKSLDTCQNGPQLKLKFVYLWKNTLYLKVSKDQKQQKLKSQYSKNMNIIWKI